MVVSCFKERAEPHIYSKVLAGISKSRPLSGESARIFLYLLGQASHENTILGPSDVARELDLQQPNVSRAYREMINKSYLLKDDETYRIHPFICFCGSESKREAILSKMAVSAISQWEASPSGGADSQ